MTDPIAVTIPEAVRLSGLGRSTLYVAIKDGDVKAVKAGRRTLVLVESIKAFIDALPNFSGAA